MLEHFSEGFLCTKVNFDCKQTICSISCLDVQISSVMSDVLYLTCKTVTPVFDGTRETIRCQLYGLVMFMHGFVALTVSGTWGREWAHKWRL